MRDLENNFSCANLLEEIVQGELRFCYKLLTRCPDFSKTFNLMRTFEDFPNTSRRKPGDFFKKSPRNPGCYPKIA